MLPKQYCMCWCIQLFSRSKLSLTLAQSFCLKMLKLVKAKLMLRYLNWQSFQAVCVIKWLCDLVVDEFFYSARTHCIRLISAGNRWICFLLYFYFSSTVVPVFDGDVCIDDDKKLIATSCLLRAEQRKWDVWCNSIHFEAHASAINDSIHVHLGAMPRLPPFVAHFIVRCFM